MRPQGETERYTASMTSGAPDKGVFADSFAHLRAELDWLDGLIRARIGVDGPDTELRFSADGRGLYIGRDEVERLTDPDRAKSPCGASRAQDLDALAAVKREIRSRAGISIEAGAFLGLAQLERMFSLSQFESDCLLVCLAPELSRKYDTLYAYLQDDISRKRPSVDLVLRLLCGSVEERWHASAYLQPAAPLFRLGLLNRLEDLASPSGSDALTSLLQLDPRLVQYVLGNRATDGRICELIDLDENPSRHLHSIDGGRPDGILSRQPALVEDIDAYLRSGHREPLVLFLGGPAGSGRLDLARQVCARLGTGLLQTDGARLVKESGGAGLGYVLREGLLWQMPVYLRGMQDLLRDAQVLAGLSSALERFGWLVFLDGDRPWRGRTPIDNVCWQHLAFEKPAVPERRRAWSDALSGIPEVAAVDDTADQLSRRFRLNRGQIRDVARRLRHDTSLRGPSQVSVERISGICRELSITRLPELATQVLPRYTWDDLVLPEDRMAKLGELAAQIRHHHRVFEEWGFGRRIAYGRGASALFSGPSGTGKTLAAEAIAHDLGLDLYKIDLARVVNKYIGETEKNLARIFDEAEGTDAVLFFDEADALFGKRTTVSDAHDRYANIETSYLLQRMEQHDGAVILASNLRENMDEAFLRRIRYLIEFPFPDEGNRRRIWRGHLPETAPLDDGIDLDFLAREIRVAGGNIRNIVLNAAFLAAERGGSIDMAALLLGARRELEKIGMLWDEKRMSAIDRKTEAEA